MSLASKVGVEIEPVGLDVSGKEVGLVTMSDAEKEGWPVLDEGEAVEIAVVGLDVSSSAGGLETLPLPSNDGCWVMGSVEAGPDVGLRTKSDTANDGWPVCVVGLDVVSAGARDNLPDASNDG